MGAAQKKCLKNWKEIQKCKLVWNSGEGKIRIFWWYVGDGWYIGEIWYINDWYMIEIAAMYQMDIIWVMFFAWFRGCATISKMSTFQIFPNFCRGVGVIKSNIFPKFK